MDPFTHLLITRFLVGNEPATLLTGLLPDAPFYLTYPAWVISQGKVKQSISTNEWPEPPAWMKTLHHAFHSLPVLLAVTVFIWLICKKYPKKLALVWALHILIDIPSHSKKQWGPQFLWPLSEYAFDGVSWVEMGTEIATGRRITSRTHSEIQTRCQHFQEQPCPDWQP